MDILISLRSSLRFSINYFLLVEHSSHPSLRRVAVFAFLLKYKLLISLSRLYFA
nr:MAG TPA: hypothetical protein [Caudoviricetes sp.]DAG73754.1 MAG TPA: hypothetical protein [Bacteriophage sp.]DAI28478.1 MAG TPA: hypothetical protein [Caudoviricetes sp.]DAT24518.1 MAG TPA: hypothetical protein [Caudoviricetes sp.]